MASDLGLETTRSDEEATTTVVVLVNWALDASFEVELAVQALRIGGGGSASVRALRRPRRAARALSSAVLEAPAVDRESSASMAPKVP